jgi:hypothetical protein
MLLPKCIGCQNNNVRFVIFFYDINIYLRMGSPAPGVPPKSIDMDGRISNRFPSWKLSVKNIF